MCAVCQNSKEPLVTFGVLTDVQFADCDNLPAPYDKSKLRFYRGSLNQVDAAFDYWEKSSTKVQFVLQLGDIIDGRSQQCPGGSYSSLRRTLEHFEKHTSIPTFHTVGNHELYNFNRIKLAQLFYESVMKFNISPELFTLENPFKYESKTSDPVLYYKFCPVPSVKCISLDCFDVSVLGYDRTHPKYKEAAEILKLKHGHDIFEDWDCNGELQGLEIRFQQMNGAVGREQLKWLDEELSESETLQQKVIVFGHVSISPESTDASCILWNYEEVMKVFHKYSCVVAYFSGHSHVSGYAIDSHGIRYVVFTGIIETPPATFAFATVTIFEDSLSICGQGIEQSYSFPLKQKSLDSEVAVESDITSSPVIRVKV